MSKVVGIEELTNQSVFLVSQDRRKPNKSSLHAQSLASGSLVAPIRWQAGFIRKSITPWYKWNVMIGIEQAPSELTGNNMIATKQLCYASACDIIRYCRSHLLLLYTISIVVFFHQCGHPWVWSWCMCTIYFLVDHIMILGSKILGQFFVDSHRVIIFWKKSVFCPPTMAEVWF